MKSEKSEFLQDDAAMRCISPVTRIFHTWLTPSTLLRRFTLHFVEANYHSSFTTTLIFVCKTKITFTFIVLTV